MRVRALHPPLYLGSCQRGLCLGLQNLVDWFDSNTTLYIYDCNGHELVERYQTIDRRLISQNVLTEWSDLGHQTTSMIPEIPVVGLQSHIKVVNMVPRIYNI